MTEAAKAQQYNLTHEQHMLDQAKLMRDQMGELSEYYKLAEGLYSYKNLESQTDVSITYC
jgi:3-deoxy-D-manno-octulosonic-acid transferase